LADVSSRYRPLFAFDTATNAGVVQPLPQSNGDPVVTGVPLTMVVELRTSLSWPAEPAEEPVRILKIEILCEP